jgi:hypothetical protein
MAWICALPLELAAAKSILDETHDPLPQLPNDENTYTLGKIYGYNVVVTCLPARTTGPQQQQMWLAACNQPSLIYVSA